MSLWTTRSLNLSFSVFLKFLMASSLSTRCFAGISLDEPVVTSCGTGVTACILALVSPFLLSLQSDSQRKKC